MIDPLCFSIEGRGIGGDNPCFLIAEVGINHNGDEATCARMISAAAAAGADAVKLQTVTPDDSYHPSTPSYQVFKNKTLTKDALDRLVAHARKQKIILFSTPGDFRALALMREVGMSAIKISSGLLTNLPLIKAAARGGEPLILSTGMAHLDEVQEAVTTAREAGCRNLAVLQCTSLYPASAETLNLRAMATLCERFRACVGYSDHHPGHLAVLAAVASGASIIEKHFTLDVTSPGADHAISIDAPQFAQMVHDVRQVEAMLGSREKAPIASEIALREGRHRRLVAGRDLEVGAEIAPSDLLLMRLPSDIPALPASRLDDVVGRRTATRIPRLSGLTAAMVEGLT